MRDEKTNPERQAGRRDPERVPREVAYDGRQAEQRALVQHSRQERSRHVDGQYGQLSNSPPPKHDRGTYPEEAYGQVVHRPARRERSVERPREYHREYRSSLGPKFTPEEIKDALITLYSNVKKASIFLSGFKEEFEQDILRVKTYAEAEDLAYLWVDKVNFSNDIGPPAQRQIAQGKAINGQVLRFRDVASQLKASLNLATRNSNSGHAEQNIAVGKKLSNANNEIHELLRRASNSVQNVDPLLTELEMLAILLERNGAGKALTNGQQPIHTTGEAGLRDQRQQSVDSGYEGSLGGQASFSQQSDQGDEQGQNDNGVGGHESEQAAGTGGGDSPEGDTQIY